jgi:hypothetical protein
MELLCYYPTFAFLRWAILVQDGDALPEAFQIPMLLKKFSVPRCSCAKENGSNSVPRNRVKDNTQNLV